MPDPIIFSARNTHVFPGLRLELALGDAQLLSKFLQHSPVIDIAVEFSDGVMVFGSIEKYADAVTGDMDQSLILRLDAHVTGKGSEIGAKTWLVTVQQQAQTTVHYKVRKRLAN